MLEEDFWWRKGSSEKYGSNSPTFQESVFMWTRGMIWNKNDFIRSFMSRATTDRLGPGAAMADRPADDGQGDPGDERERTGKSLA
jgi:hypothetical protein